MKELLGFCPKAPDWSLDWEAISAAYDWVRALEGCPQDPRWHAEGNVWVHTEMVLRELVRSTEWRKLDGAQRQLIFAACLLHDVEKPSTTVQQSDGRITAKHHSEKGALRARRILWELGAAPEFRERVAHLVLHHQVPFFLVGRADAERRISRISWTAGCAALVQVARADMRGRVCEDQAGRLEDIELFAELAREHACLDRPREFASDAHRVAYFASPGRAVNAPVPPRAKCRVIVMSGLPGSGKDHWIERKGPGDPVVSLDRIREELGVDPADGQGRVVQLAQERARSHLRAGTNFIWNATNLSRRLRSKVLDLCHRYGAHTHIVHVETDPKTWRLRNRQRSAPVPESVLTRMLTQWQVPDATEAHRVDHVQS